MMNNEVYNFTPFTGTAASCKLSEAKSCFAGRKAASHEPRVASRESFAPLRLCEKKILCAFAPWREKDLNTESTKKTQRKAASYEPRAASGKPRATSREPFAPLRLCEKEKLKRKTFATETNSLKLEACS